MRICIDLDGVICELRRKDQEYGQLSVLPGAIESIKKLRSAGHYVILHTARHMNTTQANLGLVVARQGFTTLEWLKNNGIEYDEIYFGKPFADVYIDDNAFKFIDWDSTMKGLFN